MRILMVVLIAMLLGACASPNETTAPAAQAPPHRAELSTSGTIADGVVEALLLTQDAVSCLSLLVSDR